MPITELADLDIESFQSHLGRPGAGPLLVRRASWPLEPRAMEALSACEQAIELEHTGTFDELSSALSRMLAARELEKPLCRDVHGEIMQLARFFCGLVGDPRLRVRLAMGQRYPDFVGEPSAGSPGSLALVCPLIGPTPRWHGLPHGSVVVGWGIDPGGGPGAGRPPELLEGATQPSAALVVTMGAVGKPYFLAAPRRAPARDARAVSLAGQAARVDVVLVSMPFGPLRWPSLGLAMLEAALDDIRTEILYFTFGFARRIGAPLYEWIANYNPAQEVLAGEWIFSRAAFADPTHPRGGDAPAGATEDDYIRELLADVRASAVADLLRCRDKVEPFLDECVAEIVARSPRVVGFTSMFQQHVASLALAARVKQALPDVAIIMGGANCEGRMGVELVRQIDAIDAVVSGEAEGVFAEVIAGLLAGRSLAGLPGVYTRGSAFLASSAPSNAPMVADLDTLPRPDYSDFFAQWHDNPFLAAYRPQLLFETSRGCWWGEKHHCTFCGLNGTSMKYRSKSADRAVDELVQLIETHGCTTIQMVDNILDMSYFKTFLPALAKRELGVSLFYETKANLAKDQLRILRRAGFSAVQPGVESLSDEVLRLMRKGVSALQNIQLLKWCLELGIWPYWNILWGFPGESPEAYDEVARLIPLLHHLPPPGGASRIRLDRFSPNFDEAWERGFDEVAPIRAYRHIYPFEDRALASIAYHFRYQYRDRRDPTRYTAAMVAAVDRWRDAYSRSHLVYTDKESALLIWDQRAVAKRNVTVLGRVERAVYLACDRISSLGRLRDESSAAVGYPVSGEQIADIVSTLVADGLMIRNGPRFLGLALPLAALSAASATGHGQAA